MVAYEPTPINYSITKKKKNYKLLQKIMINKNAVRGALKYE